MIVFGSQGRTGLDHRTLGAKAAQVLLLPALPVLIVKDHKKRH